MIQYHTIQYQTIILYMYIQRNRKCELYGFINWYELHE